MAKTNVLSAPIPGMSLTTEPGARPWEQPPQLTEISEVVDFYTDKFTNAELVDNLLMAVKEDIPIFDLVKSLTTSGVMQGKHSVDTGVIVQPVLVEMLKTLAELNGIGYVLTAEDLEKSTSVDRTIAEKAIEEVKMAGASPVVEEEMEEEKPKGLMARGER